MCCDVYTTDASGLYAGRMALADPDDNIILPEIISKEPLGPVVRQGDDRWFNIVKWSNFAMINAEELGVTSRKVDEKATSENPEIRRLLGFEGNFGKTMGLGPEWAYRIVKLVGNYGEVFDRNLGESSPLKIKRGMNGLWSKGGLLYAPPIPEQDLGLSSGSESSALPDLIVGLGIAAMNADATRFSRRRHHPTGVMSTAAMAGSRTRGRRRVRRKSVLEPHMNKGFTRGSAEREDMTPRQVRMLAFRRNDHDQTYFLFRCYRCDTCATADCSCSAHTRHGRRRSGDRHGNADGGWSTGGSWWSRSFGRPEREGSRIHDEREPTARQSDAEGGRRDGLAD